VTENLVKEKVTTESLHQALREHGITNVSDVRIAVLEIDGSVSVLKNDEMPTESRPHHHMRFLSRQNP
jgi:uncharacterized membrane protein YcaP (DUF421 family)